MSKGNEPDRFEEWPIDSAWFDLDPSELSELDASERDPDPIHPSDELLAGLIELSSTEMQSMPERLQQSILESGKEFIKQKKNQN